MSDDDLRCRTAELKMLGNGVVSARAALAFELLDPNE